MCPLASSVTPVFFVNEWEADAYKLINLTQNFQNLVKKVESERIVQDALSY